MRVLIQGAGVRQAHFTQIVAAIVQQWGYEVHILSGASAANNEYMYAGEADVLLCDLDAVSSMTTLEMARHGVATATAATSASSSTAYESHLPAGCEEWSARVRFTVALSSFSISRATLEKLRAVGLLQKPFEMAELQRYLRVFQSILLDQPALNGSCKALQGVDQARVRVLVLDDHKEVANTIRQCLECEPSYDVKVANEGIEALELCMEWRPQCIVTDLLMPSMNGYQVMRCLAAGASHYAPVFVVLSALRQRELAARDGWPGGKEIVYLDKPFQIDQLLQAVEQALAQ